MTPGPVLAEIEKFIRRNAIPVTLFGRLAMRDPRFVLDLRDGRQPRPATRARVQEFMRDWQQSSMGRKGMAE